MGLRERKKRRTTQALQDSAQALFTKKGYEHTTVDDIAAAAGVSTRTFYRYFAGKDDVVLRPLGDVLEQHRELLASRPKDEPPLQALRESLVDFAPAAEEFATRERVELIRETRELRRGALDVCSGWHEAVASDLAARQSGDDRRGLWLASGMAITLGLGSLKVWIEKGGRPQGLAQSVLETFGSVGELLRQGIGLG